MQPMDQGVIRMLKSSTDLKLLNYALPILRLKGKKIHKIRILDLMFVAQTWIKVNKETVQTCRRCAGIFL